MAGVCAWFAKGSFALLLGSDGELWDDLPEVYVDRVWSDVRLGEEQERMVLTVRRMQAEEREILREAQRLAKNSNSDIRIRENRATDEIVTNPQLWEGSESEQKVHSSRDCTRYHSHHHYHHRFCTRSSLAVHPPHLITPTT